MNSNEELVEALDLFENQQQQQQQTGGALARARFVFQREAVVERQSVQMGVRERIF